jgi:hypothetical protein
VQKAHTYEKHAYMINKCDQRDVRKSLGSRERERERRRRKTSTITEK